MGGRLERRCPGGLYLLLSQTRVHMGRAARFVRLLEYLGMNHRLRSRLGGCRSSIYFRLTLIRLKDQVGLEHFLV